MNKIHIAKRDTLPLYINIAIRGGAIILALLVCALVTTVLTGENPLSIYGTILKGAFGTARKSWTTWENVAILLGISLAVTPAFKMRFWNIGAEGQVLIGCLASAACMITLGNKIPNGLLLVIMFVASLGMGALWGFLPGFFKARWNTNETLFTLMMNYIATQLVAYFIIIWEVPKGAGKIGIINQDSQAGWLPTIGNQKYLLAILVVAVLTGLMYIYLNYSKQGYEIAMHIVIYLEALFPAVFAANAVAVRQLLRLDQIDVRTTDSTLISHKFPPFSDNVGLFLAFLAYA